MNYAHFFAPSLLLSVRDITLDANLDDLKSDNGTQLDRIELDSLGRKLPVA